MVSIPECPALHRQSWISVDAVAFVVESAGHLLHGVTSVTCLYSPTAHTVHLSAAVLMVPKYPGLQTQSEGSVHAAPLLPQPLLQTTVLEFAGQLVQVLVPSNALKVPEAHSLHASPVLLIVPLSTISGSRLKKLCSGGEREGWRVALTSFGTQAFSQLGACIFRRDGVGGAIRASGGAFFRFISS